MLRTWADLGGGPRGPCPAPPFSLGFILKTIAANRLLCSIVESELCCGYGVRLRCRRKFFRPPLSDISGSAPRATNIYSFPGSKIDVLMACLDIILVYHFAVILFEFVDERWKLLLQLQ